ncbi:hypothetical protein NQ315_012142 [Exocentrus adspersus]|uniref:guanylate cyclase n=1 Tax=Exocentrus adspersus TaxID=1586481 RepID=A0AAV8VXR6_9CUCU|nr:hypothetical protein NQ315_012142 [Exocentrus adspersus]
MYGMLIESVQHFVQLEYGEEIWKEILKVADCKYTVFNTHQVYPDDILSSLAAACAIVTNASYDGFMNFFGRCFVRYFTNLGYDVTIRATGRYFTDFLESVDNIHTQFRFTYPKMQSPSMYLTSVDASQLQQIAKDFFNLKLSVKVLDKVSSATATKNYVIVTFRLDFDNRSYMLYKAQKESFHQDGLLPSFPCKLLLELFPFGIILNTEMKIMGSGDKFIDIWRGDDTFLNKPVEQFFSLRRPKGILFSWKNTLNLQSVMFELECNRGSVTQISDGKESPVMGTKNVLLKGQMKYIRDINAIIFLCSPVINDLDELPEQGLYLNDLNPHGLSKELVLAGWQHNSKLEMNFDKAEQRSNELEQSYELLDKWKRKGDDLLYSMIPKPVADRLRTGKASSINTCESFEAVSILFCELVGLTSTTVKETMVVVTTMNAVFSCFDELMDKFNVYKVETVGQVYMVASGAPEKTELHAQNIADLSLAMLKHVKKIITIDGKEVDVRIGIHSGPAVAGVVGLKSGKINISSYTKNLLPAEKYTIESRGVVKVKGKGDMQTYWLLGSRKWTNRN